MYSLIYIEIKPAWVSVVSDPFRHQVREPGHRWSVSHPKPEQIERLVTLLRGVGVVTEKLHAYPSVIEIVPTPGTADYVNRIATILTLLFGRL